VGVSSSIATASGPLLQIATWIERAISSGEPEPHAMTLATTTTDGRPSARVVLCRGVDDRGLRFFTNYDSRKGAELLANPHAAAVFHWPALARQIRIEGDVTRLAAPESDAYFRSRPRGHQLQAHASAQSRPIGGLDVVRLRMAEVTAEFEGREVPRPPGWGGYLIAPNAVEFWIQGADRVHERVRFERTPGAGVASWTEQRLAP
jgi:pyridoxamine 5'-phosphate oxidase